MKKNHASMLAVFAAVFFTFPMYGQSKDKHPKWVDYTGTHEVDVSVGFPTSYMMLSSNLGLGRAIMGLNNWAYDVLDWMESGEPGHSVNVESAGGAKFVPNLRAEYGYNILSWLNVGLAVNYSSFSDPMQNVDTQEYMWTEKFYLTTMTVRVKFYWLNRKWVRMYSSVGAGVGVSYSNVLSEDLEDSRSYVTHTAFAPDICLVGLTVGRKLYGRFEWGTLYGGLTAGIGYRF